MNTIIYLYCSRESVKFVWERWPEEDYCLIRLGIPALLWQKRMQLYKLPALNEEQTELQSEEKGPAECKGSRNTFGIRNRRSQGIRSRIGRFRAGLRNWSRKGRECAEPAPKDCGLKCDSDEKGKQKEIPTSQIIACLEELHELQTVFTLLGDSPYRTYCAYENSLKEKIDGELWRQYWNLPEFEDYHERMWVEQLMPYTIPGHFMILGYADCMPRILCENARKIRSIKWLLREKDYSRDVQEFIEDFFEEYGLAIEVHFLGEEEEWIRVRPTGAVPMNILDFTREEKLSACDVAKGSVWLDMDSMDGKGRRMETRTPEISYFSLKKLWKQRQKEPINLDTISKNRYNT